MASLAGGQGASRQDTDAWCRKSCDQPSSIRSWSPIASFFIPRLSVADRVLRYTAIVGGEHVIAGTDCGLGGRVHCELAWAKLRALVEGAQLASKNLWRR